MTTFTFHVSEVDLDGCRRSHAEGFKDVHLVCNPLHPTSVTAIDVWLEGPAGRARIGHMPDDLTLRITELSTATLVRLWEFQPDTYMCSIEVRGAAEAEDDVWVQCNDCEKWRRLPPGGVHLPETWTCYMNTWDMQRNSCADDEEIEDWRVKKKTPSLDTRDARDSPRRCEVET